MPPVGAGRALVWCVRMVRNSREQTAKEWWLLSPLVELRELKM